MFCMLYSTCDTHGTRIQRHTTSHPYIQHTCIPQRSTTKLNIHWPDICDGHSTFYRITHPTTSPLFSAPLLIILFIIWQKTRWPARDIRSSSTHLSTPVNDEPTLYLSSFPDKVLPLISLPLKLITHFYIRWLSSTQTSYAQFTLPFTHHHWPAHHWHGRVWDSVWTACREHSRRQLSQSCIQTDSQLSHLQTKSCSLCQLTPAPGQSWIPCQSAQEQWQHPPLPITWKFCSTNSVAQRIHA